MVALGSAVALALAAAPTAGASLTPNQIHAAYALPKTGARHQTIAIVSAYDDPDVQADLNDYTKRFGIPACTTAKRCFRILNQNGTPSPLPQRDPTGGVFITESSVGVEVARGVCQSCSIMLVEAGSFSQTDLSAAVATAARAGAGVIVTTFNLPESLNDAGYAPDFVHSRSIVVAASGDSGFSGPPSFPGSLPGVLAVGGTNLNLGRGGAYRRETAWNDTTSGCSQFQSAGQWQAGLASSVGCGAHRAVADLAAVANPGPLVHIQDYGSPCGPAWCEADGTSVAAPLIAGVIGLAGSRGAAELPMLYAHAHSDPGAFHDVTAGSTSGCAGQPICSARAGYDGPTGLGTPYGLAAFLADGGAVNRRHPEFAIAAPHGRLSVTRQWSTRVTLRNRNPFAIHGTLALSRFASARFTIPPLASRTVSLVVRGAQRGLLKSLGRVSVTASAKIRGPAGRAVTVRRGLLISAP